MGDLLNPFTISFAHNSQGQYCNSWLADEETEAQKGEVSYQVPTELVSGGIRD